MSFRNCPKPNLVHYQSGNSFVASIVSIASSTKGLFYVLSEKMIDNFDSIEHFATNTIAEYKKPPVVGEMFIYADKNKYCYRAYRLRSNPADVTIRAYLIDIGTEIRYNFTRGHYFRMPINMQGLIPPMAIFCALDSIPFKSKLQLKSEFLEKSLCKSFKFTVTRQTEFKNALEEIQTCLVVKIEDIDSEQSEEDEADNILEKSSGDEPEPLVKYAAVTYLEDEFGGHIPFICDRISRNKNLPATGSKILIYRLEVVDVNCIYARFETQDNLRNGCSSELLALNIWMNSHLKNTYKKLPKSPVVGEMVMAIGKDFRFHRAVVKKCLSNGFFVVFLVDFGYEQFLALQNLFKFPREFTSLPFQAVRMSIGNMMSFSSAQRAKAMENIEFCLPSIRVAHVIRSSQRGAEPELTVRLFDSEGFDIGDLLMMRLCKQFAPSI